MRVGSGVGSDTEGFRNMSCNKVGFSFGVVGFKAMLIDCG